MANVLTNLGRGDITGLLLTSTYKFVGWGTGAGTAAVADTTLFTESSESRVTGTQSQQTTSVTNDTYRVVGTLTASAGRTITNAAVCASGVNTTADVALKGDFTGVVLASGDSIQFTFNLQFT